MPFRLPFLKSKDNEGGAAAAPLAHESVELLRRRSRHRLIGAAVLVLLGVIGFPLLFDSQPRPISVDIPIEIPDKTKARPLTIPAAPGAAAPGAAAVAPSPPAHPVAAGPVSAGPVGGSAAPAPKVAAQSSLAPKEEIIAAAPRAAASPPSAAPAAPPPPKASASPVAPPPASSAPAAPQSAKGDGADRAKALLEGKADPAKTPAAAETGGRFIVQAGAFADPDKARETRLKIERAGLKTYTQVAKTKDGNRIRVRVGPFATRAEADKALAKIKALDLSANILTL